MRCNDALGFKIVHTVYQNSQNDLVSTYVVLMYLFSLLVQQEEEAKTPEMKEMLDEVGFTYFLIIARLHDLDPKLAKKEGKASKNHGWSVIFYNSLIVPIMANELDNS